MKQAVIVRGPRGGAASVPRSSSLRNAGSALKHQAVAPPIHRRQLLEGAASLLVAGAATLCAAPPTAFAAPAARAPGDWSTPGLAVSERFLRITMVAARVAAPILHNTPRAPPQVPEDPSAPKFYKTPGGVKVQQLIKGSGPVAAAGDTVLFDYTLRRADGYFVYVSRRGVCVCVLHHPALFGGGGNSSRDVRLSIPPPPITPIP